MQQQQVGYGAPGMASAYPSPPSNPSFSPNPQYSYHPSYTYHTPQSPAPAPNPPDYPQESLPQQSNPPEYFPRFTPEYYPPDPSHPAVKSHFTGGNNSNSTSTPEYAPPASSYSLDPSYSPRVPSYEQSPSYDQNYSEPAWSSAGYEYPMNRSSSYGGAYGDTHNYTPRWEEFSPGPEAGGYGGFHEKPYVESSTVDFPGVYAYDGGSSQPYGARGTTGGSGLNRWGGSGDPLGDLPKLAKALPKVESESKGGGVQKYHVKLLQDSGSAGLPTNVICQIGLDGVRFVEPSSGRNLRIYPLDTITKWEVNEPTVFTFWAKTSVDYEQRRTRIQSSSYTTNAILDTLTAACVQLCEMVGKDGEASKNPSPANAAEVQKKASFADWLIRPKPPAPQEEKDHWVPDEAVTKCTACSSDFGAFLRRHHCRNCGDIFCDKCTRGRTPLSSDEDSQPVRVCDRCLAEVTHRLTNTKESSCTKYTVIQSHEDLAKKLQLEMERNAPRKSSLAAAVESESRSSANSSSQTSLLNCSKCGNISIVTGNSTRCPSCGTDPNGGKNGVTTKKSSSSVRTSEGSRRRTREVACPTCTVHLEVEVPSHGSETVECGVCQHPFLVRA